MLCLVLAGKAVASVRIHGVLRNKESDSISISYSSNRLAYYPVEIVMPVDKQGNFSADFRFPAGGYIQAELKHGNHVAEIFLHDGDSLIIAVDAAHFDSTLKFAGRGAEVQNFVAKHTIARGRLNQYTLRLRNDMGLAPEEFVKAAGAEKKEELSFVDKYGKDLPTAFSTFWKSHYTYYNYFFLEQYPVMHTAMVLRRVTDTIADSTYNILKHLPADFRDEMLNVPPYLLYLAGYFESKLKQAQFAFPLSAPGNAARFIDSVNALAYSSLPDKSAEYFVAQNLYARIRHQGADRNEAELTTFKEKWPSSEYLPLLEKQVAVATRLYPGKPAPDLELVSDSGQRLKLSDLRGKVVYLSFWSTQCRQCVGEMRADRRVKDVFTNKPVVFAYVSIDEDPATAQRLIRQFHISGYFGWTSGGWYAKEALDYGVQGLPARFLIDREGNFALQDPPAPSQKTELIVAISRLY